MLISADCVSLTMRNSGFPFADRLVGYVQMLCKLLLCPAFFPAELAYKCTKFLLV